MLKVFVNSLTVLGRLTTLIDHILRDALPKVSVGTVLVQLDCTV